MGRSVLPCSGGGLIGRRDGKGVSIRLIGQAIGLFAVTNIDDIVILALFFGQATARSGALRVVAGQYLGFTAILAAAIVGGTRRRSAPRDGDPLPRVPATGSGPARCRGRLARAPRPQRRRHRPSHR